MKNIVVSCLFLFFAANGNAQIDFNHYETLKAKGAIPADFTTLTQDKIAADHSTIPDLSKKDQAEFKKDIYYSIDGILHSGQCVYGDPVSEYVKTVAHRVLKDKPDVYKKLRFYTIKSNVANAFSTEQGIVFVTTGLVAQLANEAQLAFVLAHEISHYTQHHVVKKFTWSIENEKQSVLKLHNYSKKQEFEADVLGAKMCLKTGYSATQLYNVFDVLMFSHLPFNEIKFPKDYFNSNLFFVPEKTFTKKKYPIKIKDDWRDENSTHPNVRKRKDKIQPFLKKHFGEGKSFLGSKDDFYKVRNYARFESVRINLLNNNFTKALYQIFLLERKLPDNYTLARWKAHAWQGLLYAKTHNSWRKVTVVTRKYEGESSVLYEYVKKLKRDAVVAHALRAVEDAVNKYPKSKELLKIKKSVMQNVAAIPSWSWDKFSDKTFQEAVKANKEKEEKFKEEQADTTKKVDRQLTKYDRIKGLGAGDRTTSEALIDSTNYYYFGLSDLMKDDKFKDQFDKYQEKFKEENNDDQDGNKKKDGKEKPAKKERIVGNRLLLIEPTTEYNDKNSVNYEKSTKYNLRLEKALYSETKRAGIDLIEYGTNKLKTGGTEMFNRRNTLMCLLQQFAITKRYNQFVPLDYDLVQGIEKDEQTNQLLFAYTKYDFNKGSFRKVFWCIEFPPALPATILSAAADRRTCSVSLFIFDIDKGEVETARSREMSAAGGKWFVKSEIYNLLNEKK